MSFTARSLQELRQEYEVVVDQVNGDATDWTATVRFASHTGVSIASGFTVEMTISAVTGEACYTCDPKFWGSKLPEFVLAFHQAIDEYWERQRSSQNQ